MPFGGNIPAYAGRTLVGDARPDDFEKHPRIRGENKPERTFPRPKTETSPHTRGEPREGGLGLGLMRNIPAYAGRTEALPAFSPGFKKHPRIRGENPRLRV